MTIALWCVLAAAVLPYLALGPTRADPAFDIRHPPSGYDRMGDRARRALAAHRNGLEAFPFFAVAVVVAEMQGADRGLLDGLALAFVAARLAYTGLYLAGAGWPRSAVWTVGWALCIADFVSAA